MKSVFDFIVSPKTGRSTSSSKIGNKELLLNTELQNHNYVSRLGTIISTPLMESIEVIKGDEVIVHHNVFRRFYDVRGKEKNSKSYYEKNKYFVQPIKFMLIKEMANGKPLKGFVL